MPVIVGKQFSYLDKFNYIVLNKIVIYLMSIINFSKINIKTIKKLNFKSKVVKLLFCPIQVLNIYFRINNLLKYIV